MGKMNRQVVAGLVAVGVLACATFVSVHSEILQPSPSVRRAGMITPSVQEARKPGAEERRIHND